MKPDKFISQILKLNREQAEEIHKALYSTPEGAQALDILKGNYNSLPIVKKEKPAEESKENGENKPD